MSSSFPPVEEQLAILLRGCLFGDEVEGFGAGGAGSPVNAVAPGSTMSERGLRAQMTSELRERLTASARSGRPLRIYLGADPTARSLHIGHFVAVQKLRQFQELGHQVIFLVGDYTALIGDPSGQASERKKFTHDQVVELAADYQDQVFRVLDRKRTEIRRNGEWLSKLSFADLVELAGLFPVKWLVSRRDFADRLERGESLRLHEMLYSIMQGYDAHALQCDVQVGGYDQHFNLLAGRWIQEHFGEKPHIMLTTPLLPGTDGRKMSKSYGNEIAIRDTPEDMYGKAMRVADEFLPAYLELATALPVVRVEELKTSLTSRAVNPMEVKKELARHLVELYHGRDAASSAADHFRMVVQEKSAPEEITEVALPPELARAARGDGILWPDLIAGLKLAASKSEVRRLMQQGGFYVEQEPVTDVGARYRGGTTLVRLGKRKYYRIAG
jgi:tyrosyl-tRNA synthetase